MSRIPYPLTYNQIEQLILKWVPEWQSCGFSCVAAIARGGLMPGLVASTALSLPLYIIGYDRPNRRPHWHYHQRGKEFGKVLLIEDFAGQGYTLSDCMDFLTQQGVIFEVCCLISDEFSRVKPKWSFELPPHTKAWLPWEKTAITPLFDIHGNESHIPEHQLKNWGIDLDGILLPDLPDHKYTDNIESALLERDALLPFKHLPNLPWRNITIISGRLEIDRERTLQWLKRHGIAPHLLVLRDETKHPVEQTAQFKAAKIHEFRITHYIESCPKQAIHIAHHAPLATVFWWNDGSPVVLNGSHDKIA